MEKQNDDFLSFFLFFQNEESLHQNQFMHMLSPDR